MRRTKIVCTIGPATEPIEMLRKLAAAGMNVARLNFSHGNYKDHARRIRDVRAVELENGSAIAILQDLPGTKLRIGDISEGTVTLNQGDRFVFTTRKVPGDKNEVYLPYLELVHQAKPGKRIFVDDGQLEFNIERATDTDIVTTVVVGGTLGGHKGINMPGAFVSLPSITDKDIEDLKFGLAHDVDWVAASFVRKASDLNPLRQIISDAHKSTRLIAKIERHEAVEDIDAIIQAADGIMIARGDLGVEMPIEQVPTIQKMIIKKCNEYGKPVITATQMLDSMIRNRQPTRAEVTDVANAIFDGTDAIMLSGETAIGRFPIESVEIMSKIALEAENSIDYSRLLKEKTERVANTVTEAIAQASVEIAYDLQAAAIVTPTSSGATPRAVSKYRPAAPIIAAAMSAATWRQLALSWGVYPVLVKPAHDTDAMIAEAIDAIMQKNLIKRGETIVLTAGVPAGVPGGTNLIKVHVAGEDIRT